MSSTSVTLRLLSVVQDYSLYSIGIIFVIGLFGNIINILVFTNLKLFRSNQCAFYLIAESTVNIGELLVIFLGRYLIIIYGTDPGKTSIIWCTLRSFFGQTFRLLSASLICFAAFDQYLTTNPRIHFRQWSTLSLARRLLIISTLIWCLHGIINFIYLRVNSTTLCEITNINLIYYYSFFYYPILHGFFPVFISSLFSLLAYRNVRHLVRRQITIVRRRLDRQLTAMIFIRVIFFIILLMPYSIYRIYLLNIAINPKENLYQYAVNQLIEMIIISLMNINYGISFYIFILSSSRYRRQVKYFFAKKCWRTCEQLCHVRPNEIDPLGQISNIHASELE